MPPPHRDRASSTGSSTVGAGERQRGPGVTMHEVTSVSQPQDLCSEDRALPGEVNSDTIPAIMKRPGEMMGRNYLSSLKCGMWCPAGPRRDITSMSP